MLDELLDEKLSYLVMKASIERFGKSPSELEPSQTEGLKQQANNALVLQQRVLNSNEAQIIQIEDASLNQALSMIKDKFETKAEYKRALEANHISEAGLKEALKDELICDAVLEYVCRDIQPLSHQDALAFYQQNGEKFEQAQRCLARHILITVNDDFPENTETQALLRLSEIGKIINADNFSEQALKNSECPTAMNNGELGWVAKGQLHAELDKALFTMKANSFSHPIRSEIGYHLLWCQEHKAAHKVAFEQAEDEIKTKIYQAAKSQCQRNWMKSLAASA